MNSFTKQTGTYNLVVGGDDFTVDAGLILPSGSEPASLGDTVWHDTNADGIQDASETGIAGVTVNLYDSSGNRVTTTITNSSGNYEFVNLIPGDYIVEFVSPTGYSSSPQGTSGGNNDSDADPTTGRTDTISLSSGENNPCLLYTSPSPRDATLSRMPSSA